MAKPKVLLYPGSKWRIAEQLCEYIPLHHTYVEPFFGSGAVYFTKEPARINTINDIDSDVINLFRCIRDDAEKLARLVQCTPFSRKEYYYAFTKREAEDPYMKALYFLIRCWQSHGFRTNKYKVGWKSDISGRENAYAAWNWCRLPEWIIDIVDRLKLAQIENRPAMDILNRYNRENIFVFLDPPYLLDTRAGVQYNHEMSDVDHEEMLVKVNSMKSKIMLCGYMNPLYDSFLKKWNKISFISHTQSGQAREEIIWMNYDVTKEMEQMSLFGL